MPGKIEDYGIIGDGETVALVDCGVPVLVCWHRRPEPVDRALLTGNLVFKHDCDLVPFSHFDQRARGYNVVSEDLRRVSPRD